MEHNFKIEDTIVEYSFNELLTDEIKVQSMPYNYSVSFIDENNLSTQLKKILRVNKEKHFIFIDEKVARLYGNVFFKDQEMLGVKAIENNKALPVVTKLLDKLQEKNFTKKEVFVSAGGGITQDISAFARAVFKRGITWTYIPTTLLAMADSCIGAKSCLNYGKIKNQLGLFSSPHNVFISNSFLNTLDERDVLSGYGEIIKLSIVGGNASIEKFKELTQNQNGNRLINIDQLIRLALIVKKSVIEIDEFEKDIRRALNYGHTIGHAIEPIVNYKIPHGIAVSIGMVIENFMAVQFGSLSSEEAEKLNAIISSFVDKKSIKLLENISIEKLVSNMKRDKKAMSNDVFISVPSNIGYFDMLKVETGEAFEQFLSSTFKNITNIFHLSN
jgi:3-dehydroquinate synthase